MRKFFGTAARSLLARAVSPATRARPRRAQGRRIWNRQAGVSAHELVVSLGLFSAVAVAGVPIFDNLSQIFDLRGAANETFFFLQQVRSTAITQNTPYRVKLTPNGKLAVYKRAGSVWTKISKVEAPSQAANVAVAAPSDIVFSPDGSVPVKGTITITNARGVYKSIAVSDCGRIRILRTGDVQ